MKTKDSVSLRSRPTKGGGSSLFLDYTVGGVRYKDYLKMYLIPERTRMDKVQNQQTLRAAQAIRAKRVIDIANGAADIHPAKKKDIRFHEYISQFADDYEERGKRDYAVTVRKIARLYREYKPGASIHGLRKQEILGFVEFLRKKGFAESCIHAYYANLGTVLAHAFRTNVIKENPMMRIEKHERPKRPDSRREYLTIDEVRSLIDTPCRNDIVKRAFLFSCFTGLRLIDIELITWADIHDSGNGRQIEISQHKTKRMVVVPLSKNAEGQLPDRGKAPDDDRVWKDLPCRSSIGDHISSWVKSAGITKKITFHCSRHTYATLLITYGVDLYIVSSLLGHTDISTTQIYAKIVDKKKKEAVNLIPEF